MLAFDPQRLAAGRQDVDLRRGDEDARRQRRDRLDEMFAGIEDEENPLVPQIGDQVRRRIVDWIVSPNIEPIAVPTSFGSFNMPRSTNSTAPAKASTRSSTATATVVLPTPPPPTTETKRLAESSFERTSTSWSRPTMRLSRLGRLA